jgi:hypothetical protein|tara:strand:+ start:1845 stop:2768 length:924 start_codon:yes stop_codon:yes gene_type:complete
MIYDDIGRDGILSLANARRDANLSRMEATDQYEADVADFKDALVSEIENDFMSSGDTFKNPSNIQSPSILLDIPQEDVFLPPSFDDYLFDELPINVPPRDEQIFVPPVDNIYEDIFTPPIDDLPPFRPPVDDFPPFEPPVDMPPPFTPPPFTPPIEPPFTPPIEPPFTPPMDPPFKPPFDDGIIDPPYDPPQDPPQDPPYTPPPPVDVPTPRRRMYKPPTDFSSGVPSIRLSPGISTRTFGQAPGYVTTPIKKPILKPPQVPPKEPPRPGGMKFGGPLNAGIMRLPQSQQGDTMTTRIFQNAFKPRR